MAAAAESGDKIHVLIETMGGQYSNINIDELVEKVKEGSAEGDFKDEPVAPLRTSQVSNKRYDIFLSHLQRNAQDAIISMRMFLKQAHPNLKTFIDLEVDMKGDLTNTLKDAVLNCECFLFFISDGILQSKWCAQELRWAVEFKKNIVLVRETDERHGGIDMKNFFPQVPEDLMHVFQNIIAIPWYREPAFRDVSIKSILAAAKIEDTYAKDMAFLAQSRERLEALCGNSGVTTTAFDVISEHSIAMRVVFFMGGFQRYRNKYADLAYSLVFNVSFWTCGALCAANILYQSVPYHVVSTDLLTAYVHLPAWQGYRCWRQYVQSPECDELLTKINARPEFARMIGLACRIAGWLVLVVQVAMVSIVLSGFSLPETLGQGHDGIHKWGVRGFTVAHAGIMWFVIPPVIASMFASYSMFAFVALLHLFDVEILKEMLRDCAGIVGRFHAKRRVSSAGPVQDDASSSEHMSESNVSSKEQEDMVAQTRLLLMEDRLFEVVLDILAMLTAQTQRRIDATCKFVSSLWVHLVLFSVCQVLAISRGFMSHITDNLSGVKYEWWWGFQDFFHLGGGVVLLTAAMVLFCAVTTSFKMVPAKALELFEKARCPQVRQIQVISRITSRPYGMHILMGQVYIDVPKAAGFFFIMLLFLMDYAMAILNHADYV